MTAQNVQLVLSLLKKVRKNGNRGWVARCPGHEDVSASLSVGEGRDGRVLLNCFAGCAALHVLNSMGLTMEDLFVNPPTNDLSEAERRELFFKYQMVKWDAALDTARNDARLASIAAKILSDGGTLTREDRRALARATKRLDNAYQVLNTGPGNSRIESKFKPKERS